MVVGVGQQQGGVFHTTLPIPEGDIKPVEMRPRGTFGTFDLLAPTIEITPELRSELIDLIEQYDVKIFANLLTASYQVSSVKLDLDRDYFGIWHPIYPDYSDRCRP